LLLRGSLDEPQIAFQLAPEASDHGLELRLAGRAHRPLVDARRVTAEDAAPRRTRDARRQGCRNEEAAHGLDDPLAEAASIRPGTARAMERESHVAILAATCCLAIRGYAERHCGFPAWTRLQIS
jgi:hypothetical protein